MTKLLFIRHGFSEANRLHIFAGSTNDVPLSEQGKKQGDTVSAFIAKNYTVDRILSSPMKRAKDTVKRLAETTGLSVETDVDFVEIFGGEWEGKTFEEIEKISPKEYFIWRNDFGNACPVGGESFSKLQKRVSQAAQRVAKANEGKTVVIATHAGVLRALLAFLKEIPNQEVKNTTWVTNASLTEIIYNDGKWTVEKESFADYLGDNVTALPSNI